MSDKFLNSDDGLWMKQFITKCRKGGSDDLKIELKPLIAMCQESPKSAQVMLRSSAQAVDQKLATVRSGTDFEKKDTDMMTILGALLAAYSIARNCYDQVPPELAPLLEQYPMPMALAQGSAMYMMEAEGFIKKKSSTTDNFLNSADGIWMRQVLENCFPGGLKVNWNLLIKMCQESPKSAQAMLLTNAQLVEQSLAGKKSVSQLDDIGQALILGAVFIAYTVSRNCYDKTPPELEPLLNQHPIIIECVNIASNTFLEVEDKSKKKSKWKFW